MNPTPRTEDRVLSALREAQPPEGMAARLLARLEDARVEPGGREIAQLHQPGLLPQSPLQAGPLRWFATAATIVVALAAGWYVARARNEARRVTASDAGTAVLPRPAEAQPMRAETGDGAPEQRPERRGGVARRTAGAGLAGGSTMGSSSLDGTHASPGTPWARGGDGGAALPSSAEGAPVSHPAPPIPVTAQERLLLRYARHSPAEDLLQVSNERRDAQQEREATEFRVFFQPPPSMNGESE